MTETLGRQWTVIIALMICALATGCGKSGGGGIKLPHSNCPVTTRAPVTQSPTTSTTTWVCRHIGNREITIDGKLDDDGWKAIEPLKDFTVLNTHASPLFATTAKVAFDEDYFYLGFDCTADAIRTQAKSRDEHVWDGDAVELFLVPKGANSPYYEIDFTPNNVLYDCRLLPEGDQAKFADHWAAAFNPGIVSQTHIRRDSSGNVTGWSLEAAIPFRDLDMAGGEAPPSGEVWLFNVYRGVLLADNKSFELQHWGIVKEHFHQMAQFPRLKFLRGK